MRKDRYIEQFTEHLPYLRRLVIGSNVTYDEANDILSKCAENLLSKKLYNKIKPTTLKAFLRTHVKFGIQNFKQAQISRSLNTAKFPDTEQWWIDQGTVEVLHAFDLALIEQRECPFCFQANLNQHGACGMCHTIVPSHIRVQRKGVNITKESVLVEFDFDTYIDIKNAIAQLTPFEQQVVKAIGLGNETLDSFALVSNYSRSKIDRTWVNAKAKLQDLLYEYNGNDLSKRGANAFRTALQRIEKQEKKKV